MKFTLRPVIFHCAWLSLVISAVVSRAASNGSDDASTYTTSTWITGSNGGTGFDPWTLTASTPSGGSAGFFIDSSTRLGGGASIDTSSKAFGMYGNGNSSAYAFANRSFKNGALSLNQSFSLDVAANYLNGQRGLNVYSGNSLSFTFEGADEDGGYVVKNATTGGSLGGYSANSSFHITFLQSSLNGGSWSISRYGGAATFNSGSFTGNLTNFSLYVGKTDAGSNPSDFYANNFAVSGGSNPTPEATSAMLFGSGMLSLLGARRRKNSDMIASA